MQDIRFDMPRPRANGCTNGNGNGHHADDADAKAPFTSIDDALRAGQKRYLIGLDVGSTTVKAVVVDAETDAPLWQDYQRHETKQPEKVLEFLRRIAADLGLRPGPHVRMFATGSGSSGLCRH